MRGVALLCLLSVAPADAEVRYASFASPSLGRDVEYSVDLPASYGNGETRYPVIYALHGLFEGASFWERRGLSETLGAAIAAGELPEVIVVAVDGGNSFFVNSPGGRYEDLVTRDIVAHVESTYRVIRGRGGRGLLGVSMGGYAALRIALTRASAFSSVAAHSAMLLQNIPSAQNGAGRWHMKAFHEVFGDPIDMGRWSAADPLVWAEKSAPAGLPALYFDCGTQDRFGLAAGNLELHRLLEAQGVSHEFGLHPGDHGYEYVRSVLRRSLGFLGRRLGADRGAAETTSR